MGLLDAVNEAVKIGRYRPDPNRVGRLLNKIARDQKVEPIEMLLPILESDSDTKIVNHGMNEQDVRHVMKKSWVATTSDGSAPFDTPDRYSVGIEYLFVNGITAIWSGHVTGGLAGQTLNHPMRE